MQELIEEAKQQMEKVLSLTESELAGIRVGRSQPSLVEHLKVKAYNTQMELRELATISAPDPAQLIVSPWDKGILQDIEKAFLTSSLNLQPIIDNDFIRIKIPALTQERREELVKEVKQKIESGKIMLRDVRKEIKEKIEGKKDEPGVSEDDIFAKIEELQKLIDDFQVKLETLAKKKEEALMTI